MKDAAGAIRRFHITLDLYDAGVALQRQTFRRRFPLDSSDRIDARVREWLQQRPGAAAGDGPQPRMTPERPQDAMDLRPGYRAMTPQGLPPV